MVNLTSIFPDGFNAAEYDPQRRIAEIASDPRDYARYLWEQYTEQDNDIPPALALDLARYSRDVYDAFQAWAWGQDVEALSIEWQAALGRLLARKPPRRGVGETMRRNARLRAIATALCREYGRKYSAKYDLRPTSSDLANILAGLPGVGIDSRGIRTNILKNLQL